MEPASLNRGVDRIVRALGTSRSDIIPILHAIQKEFHYLPENALRRVCEITSITPADITGISTFYSQFQHAPVGRHMIHLCNGTACHVKGSERIYDALRRELKIEDGLDTDPAGRFTVQKVACLGCCTLAPVVQIDGVTYGHVQTDRVAAVLRDFLDLQDGRRAEGPSRRGGLESRGEIRIGMGSCCIAGGSARVRDALETCFEEIGVRSEVKRVGCVGMCHRTPLLEVNTEDGETALYANVRPDEVKDIVRRHYRPKSLRRRAKNSVFTFLENWLFDPPADGSGRPPLPARDPHVTAFLGRQHHIATEHSGRMDPLDLAEYRAHEGFQALERCLAGLAPDEVIDRITASGLRGRGGAGFPSGRKWRTARKAPDPVKWIICNGDEGDPGAFMDRMILESYPFRVIEGMAMAAYAVGAHEGYFYIRAEYPMAVERVKDALKQCRETGWLGNDILGSGFSLNLRVMEGAGAFVCGEETALIASLEGRRGNPRFRPPYPAEEGLWGHPTLVNNCETLATVPWIIRNGSAAFAALGTDRSKGTKVFSLAGKILRGGLIEVPMGITIREIVEDIGGGIENGRTFKAVQIGGPSGGCLPASMADTRVDFEDLTGAGAMMGSGGLLVLDDSDCMVDIARYFLTFTCGQSCGKCTFCRIGTHRMLHLLEEICAGRGCPDDLRKLEEIARKTQRGSLCGLGKTAPNPVLTTLAYFRAEYEAHLEGRCPAKRCQALIAYAIDDRCIGCTVCAQRCPAKAISIAPYQKHVINRDLCTKCDICRQVCPSEAVVIQ